MSLWFVTAAILPEMVRDADISPARQAALSSAVQAGFVFGALVSAIGGFADRYDPRRVFAICAILAAILNGLIVILPIGGTGAILVRFATGALLAGVYPVGMKIAVGWGQKDRGFLVGLLVGALVLGSAVPHLFSLAGGPDWRITVLAASAASLIAGLAVFFTALGPHHAKAARFDPRAVLIAWRNRPVRLAYAGYLGHMWELYAMWAWIAVACTASFVMTMEQEAAETLARITTFAAIAVGGLTSVVAGKIADRIGKAEVAGVSMLISGSCAVLTALTFGIAPWLTILVVVIWGASIVPDSAQFSALVADNAPPENAGSLMTFQTALGFALTFVTVQITPVLAESYGWPPVLAAMAIGPMVGIIAMVRLRRLTS